MDQREHSSRTQDRNSSVSTFETATRHLLRHGTVRATQISGSAIPTDCCSPNNHGCYFRLTVYGKIREIVGLKREKSDKPSTDANGGSSCMCVLCYAGASLDAEPSRKRRHFLSQLEDCAAEDDELEAYLRTPFPHHQTKSVFVKPFARERIALGTSSSSGPPLARNSSRAWQNLPGSFWPRQVPAHPSLFRNHPVGCLRPILTRG